MDGHREVRSRSTNATDDSRLVRGANMDPTPNCMLKPNLIFLDNNARLHIALSRFKQHLPPVQDVRSLRLVLPHLWDILDENDLDHVILRKPRLVEAVIANRGGIICY